MLIRRVQEESGDARGERGGDPEVAHNFQTASELFELMAKDHDFEAAGEDPLTARDLVLLYKNIELGEHLMSSVHRRRPNQHVETVVYRGARDSDSDLSDTYSNRDMRDIVTINEERIDQLTNRSNNLCHKLGDTEIQMSDFTSGYDRHFLFKDPYIKEQLRNLKLMSDTDADGTVLPASLLDYICCKRLEDNYNFYMENIIKYVKNTIEQLKRISNGDYLTDKAKRKWREVINENGIDDTAKVLATSTSIPLHVERKLTGVSSTWDDLVHSEVDLRSLAKILEKKIVLEVPKLICDSYKLFSNHQADNLIISCKRKEPAIAEEKSESRVDVVFQLQRSETGHVISNIDSIMILQAKQPTRKESLEALPSMHQEAEHKAIEETPKIIEITEAGQSIEDTASRPGTDDYSDCQTRPDMQLDAFGTTDENYSSDYPNSEVEHMASFCVESPRVPTPFQCDFSHIVRANVATPEDLNFTMQALDRQTCLQEESPNGSVFAKTKRKSPTRVRVKSPYENKSHMLEEKKRKKLLEIRERRERKKMAMNESKINKHKFCKSAIAPQASSSVTKLSISNKSFYNSIYGQNVMIENNIKPVPLEISNKTKGRKGQKIDDMIPEIVLEQPEGENAEREELFITSQENNKKYVNRSYYLDDAVTEMMFLEMKRKNGEVKMSASTSAVSNDSGAGPLSQCMSPSSPKLTEKELPSIVPETLRSEQNDVETDLAITKTAQSTVPSNTPRGSPVTRHKQIEEKVASTVECRRSIEKIYTLMNKLGKIDSQETTQAKRNRAGDVISSGDGPVSSVMRGEIQSDSGTSLKHHFIASDLSSFSFEKPLNEEVGRPIQSYDGNGTPVEPKIIINSRQQAKQSSDKSKREPQPPLSRPFAENPLKAISQLLHEFDNVQKNRQKSLSDSKSSKKETSSEEKNWRHEPNQRRGRDQPREELPVDRVGKGVSPRVRPRVVPVTEAPKSQAIVEKKRIRDLIEEVKEARGEAVRGPGRGGAPTLSSRLNQLAQPKRLYAPPRNEELAARATRPPVQERLPRRPPAERPRSRRGPDVAPSVSVKQPTQPIERAARARRPPVSSPVARRPEPATPASLLPPLKQKVVAVDTYVKNYYPRGAGTAASASRVPPSPIDLDLYSLMSSPMPEDSTAIGSKLHHMVNSKVSRDSGAAAEPSSLDDSMAQNVSFPDPPSADSDFADDVFSDKQIVTGVETFTDKSNHDLKKTDRDVDDAHSPVGSATELKMLENALYRKMSLGAFPKRLRIKNLTLTPKHSMQHFMVLQSGDTTPLVLKSKLSQNQSYLKSTSNEADLKSLPLSTTRLDWSFQQLPMQISTVGYVFPSYERDLPLNVRHKNFSKTSVLEFQNISIKSNNESAGATEASLQDKTCQCFKGSPQLRSQECAVQANNTDFPTPQDAPATVDLNHNNGILENKVDLMSVANPPQTKKQEHPSLELDNVMKETAEKSEKEIPVEYTEEITEIVDYTTSLDMLVGLLNEIQKITACTNDAVCGDTAQKYDPVINEHSELRTQNEDKGPTGNCNKLRNTSCFDSLNDPIAAKSSSSFIPLYGSNDIEIHKKRMDKSIPETKSVSAEAIILASENKEVSAQFPDAQERKQVSVFTDVPSRLQLFPPGFNDTNSVPGSLLGGSSLSRFSGYQTVSTEPSTESNKRVIELQEISTNPVSVKSLVLFHNKTLSTHNAKRSTAIINKSSVQNAVVLREKSAAGDATVKSLVVVENQPERKKHLNKCCLNATDFDYTIKMKRDLLVTVYSLLVLTVFAALSLPDVLHQT